jgi:hypothetical protein
MPNQSVLPETFRDEGESAAEREVLPAVTLAFSRLHKAAFGVATGVAGAILMGLITATVLLSPRARGFPLDLLGEYFAGYTVSWPGVAIGMAWGFLVAFVGGWFLAFCRNLSLAIIAFAIKTRAELTEMKTFLDHI